MLKYSDFTVLIVDDVARNIQIVANTLNTKGYKLLFSQNPIKAIDIVKNKNIDLILLDIMMPEKNGFDVCLEIKKIKGKEDIPVIFLTAKSDIESITKGFNVGGVDFITKPFNSEELLVRIENHLKLKDAFNVISKQNEELQNLNETKDKFFSIIAHDLRNPFNAIFMMSEVLKRRIDSIENEEARQIIDLLHLSTKEIYELLDNLLTWSRLHRDKLSFIPEKIKIANLIKSNVNLYENIAKSKNIELESHVNENLTLTADRNMLNTIVRNLLTNAIKFTHEKGKIILSVVEKETEVEFSIKDNGIGMTKEDITMLLSEKGGISKKGTADERGTGIGLLLCKEFISIHLGNLHIESKKGKGSTFIFTIKKEI